MSETDRIDDRFKRLREAVRRMVEESEKKAERHLQEGETSLEFSFHDGEAGSLRLVLNHLNEAAAKGTPVSENAIEEVYADLLVSYKRMKGNLAALERVIRMIGELFDLRTETELEQVLA